MYKAANEADRPERIRRQRKITITNSRYWTKTIKMSIDSDLITVGDKHDSIFLYDDFQFRWLEITIIEIEKTT